MSSITNKPIKQQKNNLKLDISKEDYKFLSILLGVGWE